MPQGRNYNSRYHPAYFPYNKEITHRAPTSPISVTGEPGSHYSFTFSQDRLRNQIAKSCRTGSHHPPALCSFKNKASFPSKSLNISLDTLNHNRFVLSTLTIGKSYSCRIYTKRELKKGKFFDKKTFDFYWWTMYNVRYMEKGCDEDGPASRDPRESAVGVS